MSLFVPCIIASSSSRSKGQRRQFHVGLIEADQVPPEMSDILRVPREEFEIAQISTILQVIQVTHCVDTLEEAMQCVSVLQGLTVVEVDPGDESVVRRSFTRTSFAQVASDTSVDIKPRLPRQRRRQPYLVGPGEQRI